MFTSEEKFLEWTSTLEEGTGFFTHPTYWQAVIGTSTDGAIVYDHDRMVDVLIFEEQMSEEEAIEWVDYNVIRTIPYCGQIHPIIVNSFE